MCACVCACVCVCVCVCVFVCVCVRACVRMKQLTVDITHTVSAGSGTVEPLLADTPNSGHLPYNGQCAMYQLRFPYILYFKNLPIADTLNSGHLQIADSFSGTKALANTVACQNGFRAQMAQAARRQKIARAAKRAHFK